MSREHPLHFTRYRIPQMEVSTPSCQRLSIRAKCYAADEMEVRFYNISRFTGCSIPQMAAISTPRSDQLSIWTERNTIDQIRMSCDYLSDIAGCSVTQPDSCPTSKRECLTIRTKYDTFNNMCRSPESFQHAEFTGCSIPEIRGIAHTRNS